MNERNIKKNIVQIVKISAIYRSGTDKSAIKSRVERCGGERKKIFEKSGIFLGFLLKILKISRFEFLRWSEFQPCFYIIILFYIILLFLTLFIFISLILFLKIIITSLLIFFIFILPILFNFKCFYFKILKI